MVVVRCHRNRLSSTTVEKSAHPRLPPPPQTTANANADIVAISHLPPHLQWRGGGGTAADGAGVRGRGEIDAARVEFLELDTSMGLRSRQGRGPPRPPRPRPPSRPLRRPGPPPPRLQRGRVTGIVIFLTLKRGRKQCRRSVLQPSRLPPITLLK